MQPKHFLTALVVRFHRKKTKNSESRKTKNCFQVHDTDSNNNNNNILFVINQPSLHQSGGRKLQSSLVGFYFPDGHSDNNNTIGDLVRH